MSLSLLTLFLNSSLLADFSFICFRCSSDAVLSEATMVPSSKAVKLVRVFCTLMNEKKLQDYALSLILKHKTIDAFLITSLQENQRIPLVEVLLF